MRKWRKERGVGGDWRPDNRMTAGCPLWGPMIPFTDPTAKENPMWKKGGMGL